MGKRFALEGAEIVLGNAIDGARGINLAEQEGSSPKRMAAKQAKIDRGNGMLTLRDLDSPGGTFLNKRRLLTGEARPLAEGDVIQVGGVQLRVVAPEQAKTPAKTTPQPVDTSRPVSFPAKSATTQAPAPQAPIAKPSAQAAGSAGLFTFTLQDGSVCRTWDDFLTVSSQKWLSLRDELESGRLGNFLGTIGRGELSPSPFVVGSPDEKLDAWLARLPTTKSNRPEIEVHPSDLIVKANAAGGLTRRKVRISNVGYRLLKASAAVEPPETAWLKIGRQFAGKEFATVEGIEVPIDLELPEKVERTLRATIVFTGNGGEARVNVRVEPFAAGEPIPEGGSFAETPMTTWGARDWIAGQPVAVRIATGALAGLLIRFCLVLGQMFGAGLVGASILYAIVGGTLGIVFAIWKNAWKDAPYTAFAGACAGVLSAAILLATPPTMVSIGPQAPVKGGA